MAAQQRQQSLIERPLPFLHPPRLLPSLGLPFSYPLLFLRLPFLALPSLPSAAILAPSLFTRFLTFEPTMNTRPHLGKFQFLPSPELIGILLL